MTAIPASSISCFAPIPAGENQYPDEFTESQLALILKETEKTVTVGICNPEDKNLIESLNHFHRKKIIIIRIEHDELFEYLSKANSVSSNINIEKHLFESEKLFLDRIANDAPVINLVNSLIIEAIRKRASDIHIEAFQEKVNVRYRIDGILSLFSRFDAELFPAVSSRIKIMANLNITERRLPQDGRLSVHLGKSSRDIRVSIVPTVWGESIAMRLLNRKSPFTSLESLGLSKHVLKDLKKISGLSSGLILLSGPTGSGKTTTMNAMIRDMDIANRKIITIEDPVEYAVEGVNQIQTNNPIGLTYSSILKRVLRQDPDIIVIGEIRDRETAELAVRSALTGHIVLSTIHTDDCVSVIDRLTDMGIERYLTAAVLKASITQKLVRKSTHQYKESGNNNRSLMAEYFISDGNTERMIASGYDTNIIREYLKKRGIQFLIDDTYSTQVKMEAAG